MAEDDPTLPKNVIPFKQRRLRLVASSDTQADSIGSTTVVAIEADRELLKLIDVLARKKGISMEDARSLALREGTLVLLQDHFGKDIIARDRADNSEVVLYREVLTVKPSA